MATVPPPPARSSKKGLGCLGCGCLVLALLAILFVGLVASGLYFTYTAALKITSATPATIPTFDGGDDVFNRARQKMTDFNHDVQNHQAATIHLTADEINTLLARNVSLKAKNIHLFVVFNNDQVKLQVSCPLSALTSAILKDRYLNGDVNFTLNFDSNLKQLHFILQDLQYGETEAPSQYLPQLQLQIDTAVNTQLQANPDAKKLIDQTKSIEIKNGELVIETQ